MNECPFAFVDIANLVSAYLNTDLSRRSSSDKLHRKRQHFSYFKHADINDNIDDATLYKKHYRNDNLENELENFTEDMVRSEGSENLRKRGKQTITRIFL